MASHSAPDTPHPKRKKQQHYSPERSDTTSRTVDERLRAAARYVENANKRITEETRRAANLEQQLQRQQEQIQQLHDMLTASHQERAQEEEDRGQQSEEHRRRRRGETREEKEKDTALIYGLCKAGCIDKAEVLCKDMLVGNALPNHVTYGCFLDHLSKEGSMDKAVELHDSMLAGLSANTVTSNILIRGFCKLGNFHEASKFLVEMTNHDIYPDCITFSTFIFEYFRMGNLVDLLGCGMLCLIGV